MRKSWILIGASVLLVVVAVVNRFFWSSDTRDLTTYLPPSTLASFQISRSLIAQPSYPILDGHHEIAATVQELRASWLSSETLLHKPLEDVLYFVTDDGTGLVSHVLFRFPRKVSDKEVAAIATLPLAQPLWFLKDDTRTTTRLAKKIIVVSSHPYEANYYQRETPLNISQLFQHQISISLKEKADDSVGERLPPLFTTLLSSLAAEGGDSLTAIALSPQFIRLHSETTLTEVVKAAPLLWSALPENTDTAILAPLSEISTAEGSAPGISGLLDAGISQLSSYYGVSQAAVKNNIAPLALFFSRGDAWAFGGGSEPAVMDFAKSITGAFDTAKRTSKLPDGSPFIELVPHSPAPHEELIGELPVKVWYRDDLGSVYVFEDEENSLASNNRELFEEVLAKKHVPLPPTTTRLGQAFPALKLGCNLNIEQKSIIRLILAKYVFSSEKPGFKSLSFVQTAGENSRIYSDYCLSR